MAVKKVIKAGRITFQGRKHRTPSFVKTWKHHIRKRVVVFREKARGLDLRKLIKGQTRKLRLIKWKPDIRDHRFQTHVAASVCTSAVMALVPGGLAVNVAKSASAAILSDLITEACCEKKKSPLDEALDLAKRGGSPETECVQRERRFQNRTHQAMNLAKRTTSFKPK